MVNVPAASEFAYLSTAPGADRIGHWWCVSFSEHPGISGESTDSELHRPDRCALLVVGIGRWGCRVELRRQSLGDRSARSERTTAHHREAHRQGIARAHGVRGPCNDLGTIVLTVRRAGASQDDLTYTFSNVFVTGVQWLSGGNLPQEEATFEYTQVKISYTPQNTDGTFANPILSCFDINLQQSC